MCAWRESRHCARNREPRKGRHGVPMLYLCLAYGFFLIEAKDLDEAIQPAADWPSARLGSIEVRPIEEELRGDRRYG